MSNVVKFPFAVSRRAFARKPRNSKYGTPEERARAQNGKNMHTFVFRSYDLIVESDDADLVRDVSLDVDKAQTKLKAIRRRLQGVQEQAATQVQVLTAADTKLTAAIAAALLSTRQK